jgi:hypothetical protein
MQIPEGAIAVPCQVRSEVRARVRADRAELRFVLTNRTRKRIELELGGACPGGPVTLAGLPEGFDPHHTCQAGACPAPSQSTTVVLPPRGSKVIGRTVLTTGGDACNPPLPQGSTLLSAEVQVSAPWQVCSGKPLHVVNRRGRLRRARPGEPVASPSTLQPAAPAPLPAPAPAPPRPRRDCPACGVGCPGSMPLTGLGPDGCPRCGCEPRPDLLLR